MIRGVGNCGRHRCAVRTSERVNCFPLWTLRSGFLRSTLCVWSGVLVWVPTVFTKNRDRLLEADVARKFLAELMEHKELRGLLSDEHFSVDGTQIAAWASMKSFKAKDGSSEPPGSGRNGERDFHGEKRSNATHSSSTDPEAQLYRKGPGKE